MAKFVITTLGELAANVAEEGGPAIKIVGFKIGSDYSTPATTMDDGPVGTVLYEGVPTEIRQLAGGTAVRIEIPSEVGPFEFGEITLHLADGTIYARCSLGKPQQKLSAAISGTPNVFRYWALLKLSQAPALFSIQTSSQNQLMEVDSFNTLGTPTSLLSSPNAVIVNELTPDGEDVLVWKVSDTRWAIAKYMVVGQAVATSDSSSTALVANFFEPLSSNSQNTFLLQDAQGNIRGVQALSGGTASLTSALPYTPDYGQVFDVYRAEFPGFVVPEVNGVEYNRLAALLNEFSGAPTGDTPDSAYGFGQDPLPLITDPQSVPSSVEWATLIERANEYGNLLGLPGLIGDSAFDSHWNLAFIQRTREYNQLSSLVESIVSSRLAVPHENTTLMDHLTKTRTTPWTDISLEANVVFASEDDMRSFFNSGGWLGFRADVTPDNYVQAVQEVVFTQLGYICLGSKSAYSNGPVNIEYKHGDGDLTDPGNAGFYGLTDSYRRVFQHRFPSGCGGGQERTSGIISLIVYAKRVSGTNLRLKMQIIDTSGTAFSNYSSGGTLILDGVVASGVPDGGLVYSPEIARPTITLVGSGTQW